MKITADTHVLLRAIVADDPEQASAAVKALAHAEVVAVSLTALCELSSVLQGSNGVARADVVATIRQLIETQQIEVNRSAVEAGLSVLTAGGDLPTASSPMTADGWVVPSSYRLIAKR